MATHPTRNRSFILALLLTTASATAIAQEPPGLTAQLELAAKRGEWTAAAEITRRLLAENPGDLDLLTRLARFQRSGGDLDRAADTLKRISTLAGRSSADVLEIRGDIAKAENRPADALSDYQLALRAAPDSVRLLEKLALHYLKAGEPDNAAIYYKKLATLRKDRGDHEQLARAAVRRRDWSGMVEHLSIASEIPYVSGRKYEVKNNFEALFSKVVQLGRYDRAIKANPKSLSAILDRAQLFHACGFYEEALEDAKRAVRIDSRAPLVRLSIAYYYVATGDRRKGAEFNVNVRTISGSSSNASFFNRVASHDRQIREKPGDVALLRARASLLLDHHQAPLAMEDIERALAIDPDSVAAQLLQVRALGLVGRTADARRLVRQLAEKHPDNEDILQQIGQIQMEDGLYGAAIATFDKILERRPTYESARDSRTLCYKRLQRQPPTAAVDDTSSSAPAEG